MRYSKFNFDSMYSSANGTDKRKLVLNELGRLVAQFPNEVRKALRLAGVEVMADTPPRQLIQLIAENRRNKQLIFHLSALLLVNSSKRGFSSISGGIEPRPAVNPLDNTPLQVPSAGTEEKQSIFSKIGNAVGGLFNKNKDVSDTEGLGENTNEESGGFLSKVGDFFKRNEKDLLSIGSNITQGIGNQGTGQVQVGASYPYSPPPPSVNAGRQGMSTGMKIGLAVGGLAVVGLVVFLVRRGKK